MLTLQNVAIGLNLLLHLDDMVLNVTKVLIQSWIDGHTGSVFPND